MNRQLLTLIDQLFARFGAIYSHKWTSTFTSDDMWALAKAEWAEGLEGFTAEIVLHGVKQAKQKCEWPPSIAEFRRLCLGIPDADTVAMRVARGGNDQVSDTVRTLIGTWSCRRLDEGSLMAKAKALYPEAVELVSQSKLRHLHAIESDNTKGVA